MDLKRAEEVVLACHDRMPDGSGEAALWLLERVQELEMEKERGRSYHRNLERRIDEEIKSLRGMVERTRTHRPNADSVVMDQHAIRVLERVKGGYGFQVWDPRSD